MEVLIMKIKRDSIIGDVLDKYPETAEIFFSIGMHCLGCPASRGETIEEACQVHGADIDALLVQLNAEVE
jgi:hybrid cluster-associated redox disulfide protein